MVKGTAVDNGWLLFVTRTTTRFVYDGTVAYCWRGWYSTYMGFLSRANWVAKFDWTASAPKSITQQSPSRRGSTGSTSSGSQQQNRLTSWAVQRWACFVSLDCSLCVSRLPCYCESGGPVGRTHMCSERVATRQAQQHHGDHRKRLGIRTYGMQVAPCARLFIFGSCHALLRAELACSYVK